MLPAAMASRGRRRRPAGSGKSTRRTRGSWPRSSARARRPAAAARPAPTPSGPIRRRLRSSATPRRRRLSPRVLVRRPWRLRLPPAAHRGGGRDRAAQPQRGAVDRKVRARDPRDRGQRRRLPARAGRRDGPDAAASIRRSAPIPGTASACPPRASISTSSRRAPRASSPTDGRCRRWCPRSTGPTGTGPGPHARDAGARVARWARTARVRRPCGVHAAAGCGQGDQSTTERASIRRGDARRGRRTPSRAHADRARSSGRRCASSARCPHARSDDPVFDSHARPTATQLSAARWWTCSGRASPSARPRRRGRRGVRRASAARGRARRRSAGGDAANAVRAAADPHPAVRRWVADLPRAWEIIVARDRREHRPGMRRHLRRGPRLKVGGSRRIRCRRSRSA